MSLQTYIKTMGDSRGKVDAGLIGFASQKSVNGSERSQLLSRDDKKMIT